MKELLWLSLIGYLATSSIALKFIPKQKYSCKTMSGRSRLYARDTTQTSSTPTTGPDHGANNDSSNFPLIPFSIVFGVLPLLSITILDSLIPYIVVNQNGLLDLFIWSRVYLYAMALVAIDFVSKKNCNIPSNFGERFFKVNEDVLGISLTMDAKQSAEDVGLTASLMKTSDTTQAIALPLIVASSLVVSYFINTAVSGAFNGVAGTVTSSSELMTIARQILPYIPVLPVAAVCYLFTKAELNRIISKSSVTAIAAIILVIFSFLGPSSIAWPFQNIICLAFIGIVSQVLQFPNLNTILIALGGLTLYDVISVFGTQQFTSDGVSIMETVARARISLPPSDAAAPIVENLVKWQPGLLEVVFRGRVAGGLGLGDVIFPSILSGWALRYDMSKQPPPEQRETFKSASVYVNSLIGYAVGCGLCEFNQSGGGLPALLYIVPSMVIAVALTGWWNNDIKNMLNVSKKTSVGENK